MYKTALTTLPEKMSVLIKSCLCVCDTKHEMEKCPVTYSLMVSFREEEEEEKKSPSINNKSRLLIGSI